MGVAQLTTAHRLVVRSGQSAEVNRPGFDDCYEVPHRVGQVKVHYPLTTRGLRMKIERNVWFLIIASNLVTIAIVTGAFMIFGRVKVDTCVPLSAPLGRTVVYHYPLNNRHGYLYGTWDFTGTSYLPYGYSMTPDGSSPTYATVACLNRFAQKYRGIIVDDNYHDSMTSSP